MGAYLLECDKRYVVRAQLGVATDTLDATGGIVGHASWQHVTRAALDEAAAGFVPGYAQEAPLFSALKVDGIRMSDLTRQGHPVDAKVRAVAIHKLEVLDFTPPLVDLGAPVRLLRLTALLFTAQ